MSDQTAIRSEAMTPDEVMRYSRHIIMGQVGPQGQRKLRNAKVLVIGAGGLGGGAGMLVAWPQAAGGDAGHRLPRRLPAEADRAALPD